MSEPRTYFVNVYREGIAGACGSVYDNREMADQMAARGRIACKQVTITEGEGLNDQPKEGSAAS